MTHERGILRMQPLGACGNVHTDTVVGYLGLYSVSASGDEAVLGGSAGSSG